MRIWNFGTGDKLEHVINLPSLAELIQDGYITKNKHPVYDLYILNYTNKCAAQNRWNRETVFCRGVITNNRGQIIARPFPKFFDIEKYPSDELSFSSVDPVVTEKMDGSLGILYEHFGGWSIATRGRFDSEAARAATNMLRHYTNQGWRPEKGFTYLFEIIAKETTNIVKYKRKERGLYFLCATFTRSGNTIFDFGSRANWPGPVAPRIDFTPSSPEKCKPELMTLVDGSTPASKREGAVVFFPNSNLRMKIKSSSFRLAEREEMKKKRRKGELVVT